MTPYRYTECGLDNVMIHGVEFVIDDDGEEVVSIPNINGLHKTIAEAILRRKNSISGKELKFLRTEVGMTQAELATVVHREPLTVSRWERGEHPIDSTAQVLIRILAMERLQIRSVATVSQLSEWSIPTASDTPIDIDGHDPQDYRPLAA